MIWLRDFAAVSAAALVVAAGAFGVQAYRSATPAAVVAAQAPVPAPIPRHFTTPLIVAEALVPVNAKLNLTPPRLHIDGPQLPADAVAQAQLPPEQITLAANDSELARGVAARIAEKVPAALNPYFDLYFYVSKAASGPWAQRIFIFHKNSDGALEFEESFHVSTGRERSEQYFTATPTGFFELDSHRFMPMARSAKWNDAQMPWAMFLNYSYRTQMTGVALHAAIGRRELADLGHRASGGCVRLPIDKAKALFHRIQATMSGKVPVFAFDQARGTTNTRGEMTKDAAGNVMVADGYRVLLFIDPYPGDVTRPASS
jgi:lipoprotein-anchoring transpeptidase ErfK/SrfK